MIVGVAAIEIHVHDSQSLKAKRGVVRSIVHRLRNRFNVSVSEVGGQGTWQRATIGLSMTGSEEAGVRRALSKAISFVEEMHLAQVLASEIEIIRMPLSEAEYAVEEESRLGGEDEDLPWSSNLDAGSRADPAPLSGPNVKQTDRAGDADSDFGNEE